MADSAVTLNKCQANNAVKCDPKCKASVSVAHLEQGEQSDTARLLQAQFPVDLNIFESKQISILYFKIMHRICGWHQISISLTVAYFLINLFSEGHKLYLSRCTFFNIFVFGVCHLGSTKVQQLSVF